MANNLMFTLWSDVDLAAWGLRSEDTFRAIGELYDLDANIPVNLVDINTAPGFLLETIENEGVDV